MAFSAHNDMGQNERVDVVCCTTSRRRNSNSESKFIPNPSAQPFVPKWNSSPSERLNNYLPQNADDKLYGEEIFKDRINVSDMDKSLDTMNGVNSSIPPSGPLSQHIALHLLSKVLDDETIFSLEEANSTSEHLLPLTVDPELRPGDAACSWPSPSPHASPDCITDPEQQRLSSSIPGEHIWHNSDVNHNTSMTTPISTPNSLPQGRGWVPQSPISPHGQYPAMGENGTAINGYENLPSPQMSSSVESLGNSGYYNSHYCSPTVPDEWTHLSDSESNNCGDVVEQNSFDYSRVSPVHPSVGLVCLSGSWPQKSQIYSEFSPGGKAELDGHPKNGYCNSWKGGEVPDYHGRRVQYRRSISSKSDDDSWIGRGKESLSSPLYSRQIPSNELHVRLDQCYEQLRYLEKERHKAEVEVSKFCPTRRISSSGCIPSGRLHHSPSRVDRLLVDVLKEHGKVEALVGRIERIRHSPLNINISESVDEMMACIRRLQSSRKDEISSLGGRSKHGTGPRSPDGKDLLSLVSSVRDLVISTRGCRTAVWCASQLVLAEINRMAMSAPSSRRHSSNSESGIESSLPSPGAAGVS